MNSFSGLKSTNTVFSSTWPRNPHRGQGIESQGGIVLDGCSRMEADGDPVRFANNHQVRAVTASDPSDTVTSPFRGDETSIETATTGA